MQTETLDCGHAPSEHGPHTTGYGVSTNNTRHCYDCCAKQERAEMVKTGRAVLYLTKDNDGYKLTDWPGRLTFRLWHVKRGRHNIAGVRFDFWFPGPDGHVWHGVQYGHHTQLAHCKRTKEKTKRS